MLGLLLWACLDARGEMRQEMERLEKTLDGLEEFLRRVRMDIEKGS